MTEVQEYKRDLGVRGKDIIMQGLGMKEIKGKVLCPLHNDKNPSMSWDKNSNQFYCFACNGKIDIYSYLQNYQNMTFPEAVDYVKNMIGVIAVKPVIPTQKSFRKATTEYDELTPLIVKDAEKRGLTKQTLIDWGVQSSNGINYAFRYFDENGKIKCNTFRKAGTKECLRESGTQAILWGLDHINPEEPVIITEGQFDAMTVWQAGHKNVVSVPSGINDNNWIEHSFTFLEKVKRFVIWADNDEKGIKGANEIKKRLGTDKVSVFTHNEYKDANDLLKYKDEQAVMSFLQAILIEHVDGALDMGRRVENDNYKESFCIGIKELDRHFKKLKSGDLTLIVGRDNEGKSTMVSQIIANMLKKNKVFLYSGELTPGKIEDWIMRQLIGRRKNMVDLNINEWGDTEFDVKKYVKTAIKNWYKDKFYVYEQTESSRLFNVMKQAYKKHGIKIFIIDNLMSAIYGDSESNSDQTNFVKECKRFALTYNTVVILVAHPNKEGSHEHLPLAKYHVSGSKNITNWMDNIIAVERIWPTFEPDPNHKSCEDYTKTAVIETDEGSKEIFFSTIVRCLKDRVSAGRKVFHYHFDKQSNRFHNNLNPMQEYFGWEKNIGINEIKEAFQETMEPTPWDND